MDLNELGEFNQEFGSDRAATRYLAGTIALFVFGLGGIAYGIYGFVISGVVGIVELVMVGGGILSVYVGTQVFPLAKELTSMKVQMFQAGFVVKLGDTSHPFLWNEIAKIDEIIIRRRRIKHWQIMVTRADGESFGFCEDEVDRSGELKTEMHRCATEHGIPWELQHQE